LITNSTNVKIVGSTEELGNWEVVRGPQLQWQKDGWWRVALFISDAKFPFQYKYLLYDEIDGSIKWEEGENRIFETSATDHILVIVYCTDFFR
jgi:hypothetical protein